jgi:general stress protein 26
MDTYDDINKVRQMIKDIDFCMLTTLDESGNPHSRPMSTNGEVDFDGDLWFFTYGNSHKIHEINRLSKVNASFADPDNQRWISMSGRAQVVRDRRRMEELWKPYLKAWFPRGLDEPDIALLKVDVEKVEYWESPSSKVAQAISLVSSFVAGEPASPGENREIDMKSGQSRSKDFKSIRDNTKHGVRKEKSFAPFAFIGSLGIGAAMLYLLDPQRGRSRRAYLKEKVAGLSNMAAAGR